MAREGRAHAPGLLFPQPGASLDVGEQERRDGRLVLHDSRPSNGERLPVLYGSRVGVTSSV
jgi:hypothetical protein